MKTYKLKQLGSLKNGANYPKGSYGDGVKIVNVKDLFTNRYVDLSNLSELKPGALKKEDEYLVKNDDILFSRSSLVQSGAGMCALAHGIKEKTLFCGFIIRFRIERKDIVNPLYLLYLLRTPTYRSLFTSTQQTNIANINQKTLGNIEVILPDLDEQKRIADILSEIDDKSDCNNLISSQLEDLAKTIYDYWFLQYDFPDEYGRPYKSSGGKMVWNDELKREIPEGWSITELGKTIEIKQPRIATNEIGGRLYVPIESLPRRRMSFSDTANLDKASTGLCAFDEKAILLSNRRVYFHKVCISPFNGVTRDTVIIIYPCIKSQLPYIYETLNTDHFISYATRYSYGSEQPVLSPEAVKHYQIELPPERIINLYSEKISSLIDNVLDLQKENRQLSSLRDFLLPMLMNGQVTFKEQA